MGYVNFVTGALDLLVFLISRLHHVESLDRRDPKNSLISRIVNPAAGLRVCTTFSQKLCHSGLVTPLKGDRTSSSLQMPY